MRKKSGRKLNAYEFYDLLKNVTITVDKYELKIKDITTDLKLQVLPQLMEIDKMANMIGDFSEHNIFLQTEKIAGNVNACMGFVKDEKKKLYLPNTALNKDIRDITKERSKIIAILKKDVNENLYKNITYLKKNYRIENLLENDDINKRIDIKSMRE